MGDQQNAPELSDFLPSCGTLTSHLRRTCAKALLVACPAQMYSSLKSNTIALPPQTVTAFLDARVSAMIARAVRGRPPASPKLPLVRLRVDYTGFSTINTQRFGTRFVGQVANPHDIVLWQKPPARRARVGEGNGGGRRKGWCRPGLGLHARCRFLNGAWDDHVAYQELLCKDCQWLIP